MKRELKPFVVEVKRGKRRQSFLGQFEDQTVTMTDATRRAELALFSSPPDGKVASKRGTDEPAGRILPSLIEPPPAETVVEEPPPRRRGRKPGSKNKPKLPVYAVQVSAGSVPQDEDDDDDFADDHPVAWSSDEDEPPHHDPVQAEARVDHLPEHPAKVMPDEVPSEPRMRQRLRERSTILARYVHGTSPAPGEGWTRRARRLRDGN